MYLRIKNIIKLCQINLLQIFRNLFQKLIANNQKFKIIALIFLKIKIQISII
jgi:hypothetical protein